MVWVTGWERYKKAFCQEIGISPFILGTCFHSYINVVEVRRSGIPVSDPLHELCTSSIDFHPTLKKKQPTANCLRDIVEVMKGRNVSEICWTKNERKIKASQKALRDFWDVMCSSSGGSGNAVKNHKPQSVTAAESKNESLSLTVDHRRVVSHMLICS